MRNEVINIISHSYCNKLVGGPTKVILNTLKGLDLISQPYVLNQDIRQYRYNWIHDSIEHLIEAAVLRIPVVAGPNIVVLPINLPRFIPDRSKVLYLHPSQWCVD